MLGNWHTHLLYIHFSFLNTRENLEYRILKIIIESSSLPIFYFCKIILEKINLYTTFTVNSVSVLYFLSKFKGIWRLLESQNLTIVFESDKTNSTMPIFQFQNFCRRTRLEMDVWLVPSVVIFQVRCARTSRKIHHLYSL